MESCMEQPFMMYSPIDNTNGSAIPSQPTARRRAVKVIRIGLLSSPFAIKVFLFALCRLAPVAGLFVYGKYQPAFSLINLQRTPLYRGRATRVLRPRRSARRAASASTGTRCTIVRPTHGEAVPRRQNYC